MDENGRAWHRVGTRAEITARRLRRAKAGARWVALHVWNERIYAIADECPHRGATLGNGFVDEEGYVACPEHGWQYHLATGKGHDEWEGCVATYEVREEGEEVFVRERGDHTASQGT